jgi:hypothetical protein
MREERAKNRRAGGRGERVFANLWSHQNETKGIDESHQAPEEPRVERLVLWRDRRGEGDRRVRGGKEGVCRTEMCIKL